MRKPVLWLAFVVVVALGLWLGFGMTAAVLVRPATRPAGAHVGIVAQPQVAGVAGVADVGVQGGSTSSSDPDASESAGASSGEGGSESAGETTGEPAGEPTPGHEDPEGVDVNHDCSPENPSGCDTANGEVP